MDRVKRDEQHVEALATGVISELTKSAHSSELDSTASFSGKIETSASSSLSLSAVANSSLVASVSQTSADSLVGSAMKPVIGLSFAGIMATIVLLV